MLYAVISPLSNTNRSAASQSAKWHKVSAQTSKPCIVVSSQTIFIKMDYDTFDTDIFSEINDMPGEIYDVIEYKEEYEDDKKFNVEEYIEGNTDY